MDNVDTVDVFGIIFTIINIGVICPFLSYYLYMFHQQKRQDRKVIEARNAVLVYAITIINIFSLCTERVWWCSVQVWRIFDAPMWTSWLFLAATWWVMMDLFAIKVYHLYYQQQYNIAIAQQSWRKDINPNDTNWYIQNKNTFGNPIYLIKICFIPYVLSVIIDAIIFPLFIVEEGLYFDLMHTTLASIPISIAFYIFWKARVLDDMYHIRDEISYQMCVLLATLSCYMILYSVCEFAYAGNEHAHRIEWLLYLVITMGTTASLSVVSTVYPVKLSKNEEYMLSLVNEQSPSASSSHSGFNSIRDMDLATKDPLCFRHFMDQLVHEFCAENLLFLVELVQIKHAYQVRNNGLVRIPKRNCIESYSIIMEDVEDNNNQKNVGTQELKVMQRSSEMKRNDKYFRLIDFNADPSEDCCFTFILDNKGDIITRLTFSSELPVSFILKQNPKDLHKQMKALYSKYIEDGSTHWLNIAYQLRYKYNVFFGSESELYCNYKEYDLFNAMDLVAAEMLMLLQGSFGRFTASDDYKKLIAKKIEKLGQAPTPLKPIVMRNASSYSKVRDEYDFK